MLVQCLFEDSIYSEGGGGGGASLKLPTWELQTQM